MLLDFEEVVTPTSRGTSKATRNSHTRNRTQATRNSLTRNRKCKAEEETDV